MAAPMGRNIIRQFLTSRTTFSVLHYRHVHGKNVPTISVALKKPTDYREIVVKGWVKSLQNHKKTTFLQLNDGSTRTNLQIVGIPEIFSADVTFGSCVRVEGQLVDSSHAGQAVEVQAKHVQVIGKCDPVEYPFKSGTRHPGDYTRQFPHLRPKTNTFSSLLRIRDNAASSIHQFLKNEGFCHVHTPLFTSNDCEGAGQTFTINTHLQTDTYSPMITDPDRTITIAEHRDFIAEMRAQFFQVPTHLTVSGQLHLEAITGAFARAYTLGPTFRAESSRTRHHLAEFYMLEAEVAFVESLDELMDLVEALMKSTTNRIIEENADDVKLYYKHISPDHEHLLAKLLTHDFIRLPYAEAVPILLDNNSRFDLKAEWGADLNKEHERFLCKYFANVPVFVTNFPAKIKPFYAKRNEDRRTVAAFDLLVPHVGELVGGSLREHDYEKLDHALTELDLRNKLDWYLELRKYGSAPHGGFGLGFERYIQYLLGISNIRDTIPFPRWSGSCKL